MLVEFDQPQLPTWSPLLISVNKLCKQSRSIYQSPYGLAKLITGDVGSRDRQILSQVPEETPSRIGQINEPSYGKHCHYNQSHSYMLEYYAAMKRKRLFFFFWKNRHAKIFITYCSPRKVGCKTVWTVWSHVCKIISASDYPRRYREIWKAVWQKEWQ